MVRTLWGHVASCHVRSRGTRPCHEGYGQSRRARLVTAVHVGHVGVASSIRASVAARSGCRFVRRCGRSCTAHAVARSGSTRGRRGSRPPSDGSSTSAAPRLLAPALRTLCQCSRCGGLCRCMPGGSRGSTPCDCAGRASDFKAAAVQPAPPAGAAGNGALNMRRRRPGRAM